MVTTDSPTFHVLFDSGAWCVWKFGDPAPDARFLSKALAVRNASARARRHLGGAIIIEDVHGEVEARRSVSPSDHWHPEEVRGEYCIVRPRAAV